MKKLLWCSVVLLSGVHLACSSVADLGLLGEESSAAREDLKVRGLASKSCSAPQNRQQPRQLNIRSMDCQASALHEEVVDLNLAGQGAAFANLFRSVNLDAGKKMLMGDEDFERLERLMCPDPAECSPGPVRYWDKAQFGRFALEQPLSNRWVLEELLVRNFPVQWTLFGTPAFISNSCGGCVVETPQRDVHVLRELEIAADDPRNPTGQNVDCRCDNDAWFFDVPGQSSADALTWLLYLEDMLNDALTIFPEGSDFRLGLWNEPDGLHWNGNQRQFAQMWCTSLEHLAGVLAAQGRQDVLLGGPDVSSWAGSIQNDPEPLLEELLNRCAEVVDYMTYHHYSEPGRYMFENSVPVVREWAGKEIPVDVGEYASSLGHGAADVSPCDGSAIATVPGEVPIPMGQDESSILCDHRGATKDVAMAISMAEQDHGRLYRFEVWDWGTSDMLTSRMGLLTDNSLPKPAATSFWMLSHLQGERLKVHNEFSGAHPYHLAAARSGDEIFIVIAAQNRSVTEQFVRGLLEQGYVYSDDVAPLMGTCNGMNEALSDEEKIVAAIRAELSADELRLRCPDLDDGTAMAMTQALDYARPRVGQVGKSFTLNLNVPGWRGEVERLRVDAYHNTFAETHRRWSTDMLNHVDFNFAAAEEALWDYMREPLDLLRADDGLQLEILPDSVTLLRGTIE
ncbi:MAG: hypothetical protein CMH60_01090 [Myxococcales bacterium]|nr:hypothetical protein [Myxococcales bacterium]